ncbi:DUF262 domain-containing protein [Membranihabitans maritimus]|uniref:DUF262 domain-containing protein n=1 Tax=Membranihabitans maritimus TaxID=2904244 RepID=UPI001F42FC87|nr:DUF262 domain-containing protein [Membranihabitans maritimus]
MKNSQKPDKINLGRLIEKIKKGNYQVPDFQREFAWQPWDIRELIKSIFMDYYIGTLLLWEGREENFNTLSCDPIFAFEGERQDPEYIVLDGQQRLTAMHYAFFQPEEQFRNRKNRYLYFVRLRELLDENYDEAFFYYQETKKYREILDEKELQFADHLMPLGILKGGTWELQQWILDYKAYWAEKAIESNRENPERAVRFQEYSDSANELKDIFLELLNDYQISYIALDEKLGIAKVCDIFTHINSRGVKLDTFDLLNAITRPKDIYLKEMYRQASVELDDLNYPGFEMKQYILMVMSIFEQSYCSPKYLYYLVPGEEKTIKTADGSRKNVVLIEDKEEFIERWDEAVSAILNGLKRLKNPRDFGAIASKFLPYPSIIPALSAIYHHVKSAELSNKVDIHSKVKKWYWASIFQNRYSSSVESSTTKDYLDLQKWFQDEDTIPESLLDFYRDYKQLDLHREVKNASAIYKAIFNLYIINGAKDWETFDFPEYDSIDDHHIVPKSWGKEQDLGNRINTILNRAPLTPETNRHIINNRLPNDYLRDLFDNNDEDKVYKLLDTHLISKKAVDILLREPFTVDDYDSFLDARRERIIEEITSKIIQEEVQLPEQYISLNNRIEKIELRIRDLIIEKLGVKDFAKLKEVIPSHLIPKIKGRVEREFRKNPSLKEVSQESVKFWMEFTDLQELNDIITNKSNWPQFELFFSTKPKLAGEFNDVAQLRNSIRHSRSIDQITKMKGEAAILWFEEQLKVNRNVEL